MKRSSAPRKTANLSPSVNQRLSVYALAAGAAGVSALALAQPAEAKIVYTRADRVFGRQGVVIDLNHDGINDFKLQSTTVYAGARVMLAYSLRSNRVLGKVNAFHPASRVPAGYRIGPDQDEFQQGGFFQTSNPRPSRKIGPAKILYFSRASVSQQYGPWLTGEHGYLGLQFLIKGKTHYGWARIVHTQLTSWRLTGYAYETIRNKPIIAGATKGADDENQSTDVSFKTNSPEPATLGMLALGG
jgi:hypothetical protein